MFKRKEMIKVEDAIKVIPYGSHVIVWDKDFNYQIKECRNEKEAYKLAAALLEAAGFKEVNGVYQTPAVPADKLLKYNETVKQIIMELGG